MRQTRVTFATVTVCMCLTLGTGVSVIEGQSAACAPSGGLSFICGVQNPEDLVLVPNTRWLIASGMAANSVAAFSDGSLVATVLILPGKTFADAFAQRDTGAVFQWATPSFTGTALAMRVGDELWLGSFFADRVAYRALKP